MEPGSSLSRSLDPPVTSCDQVADVVAEYPPGQQGIDGGGFKVSKLEPGYLHPGCNSFGNIFLAVACIYEAFPTILALTKIPPRYVQFESLRRRTSYRQPVVGQTKGTPKKRGAEKLKRWFQQVFLT